MCGGSRSEVAIGSDQAGRYVLTVNADNTVEQRRVQLGQSFGELRLVESGLKPDERVVVFNTGAAQKYLEALPADLPRLEKGADVAAALAR